jgi:hypothetical protein
MARRNSGPKLRWRGERNEWVITWTEQGCTRKRSTGTASREEAEIVLGEGSTRGRRAGPRDPSQALVTDMLADYVTGRASKIKSSRVVACAIDAMTPFWVGYTCADITPEACEDYAEWRDRSENTVRRELNTLASALNDAKNNRRISYEGHVWLPPKPPGKMRG